MTVSMFRAWSRFCDEPMAYMHGSWYPEGSQALCTLKSHAGKQAGNRWLVREIALPTLTTSDFNKPGISLALLPHNLHDALLHAITWAVGAASQQHQVLAMKEEVPVSAQTSSSRRSSKKREAFIAELGASLRQTAFLHNVVVIMDGTAEQRQAVFEEKALQQLIRASHALPAGVGARWRLRFPKASVERVSRQPVMAGDLPGLEAQLERIEKSVRALFGSSEALPCL